MAASIKGRKVVWALPGAIVTGIHSVTTSGVAQNLSADDGGQEHEVVDENSDICTVIFHGDKNEVKFDVTCEPTTVKPARGQEITPVSGLGLSGGRVFVKSSNVVYSNADAKKLSVSATHYPTMGADTGDGG